MTEKVGIVLLSIVTLIRCFTYLNSLPMELWDEANNATVVWELITTDSFPHLTLHSKPFFEKPPLWYYLTAVVVSVLGPTLLAFRIISAVSGILLVFLIYIASRAWYGRIAAFVSVTILLTTQQLFLRNAGGYFSTHTLQSADGDALQILLMLISTVLFERYTTKTPVWLYGAVITSSLAFLAKGPLGFLPLVIITLYMFLNRHTKKIKVRHILISVILLISVVTPWYAAMIYKYNVDFISQHFGYHMVRRFGQSLEGHYEPFWFYITLLQDKRVFLGFELLILSFIVQLKKHTLLSYTHFMPVAMTAAIFSIATLTQTKLAWYIMPVYPFAALIIGKAVRDVVLNLLKINNTDFRKRSG